MDSRPSRALAVVVVVWGCASGPPCPPTRVCGASSWQDGVNGTDSRLAIAPLVEAAGPGATTDALAVSQRMIYLRFDLAPLAEAGHVDRAVLSLDPSPTWRPSGEAQWLLARGIVSVWSRATVASGALPSVEGSPAGQVQLAASVRGPVRIDVTPMVRAWVDGASTPEGVAIGTTGPGAIFVGMGGMAQTERARLEVVYR